jgi:hypothetical protein
VDCMMWRIFFQKLDIKVEIKDNYWCRPRSLWRLLPAPMRLLWLSKWLLASFPRTSQQRLSGII